MLLLSILAIAAISCGGGSDPDTPENNGGDDTTTVTTKSDTLLTCSFNIRYYNTSDTYPWSVRKDAVVKFINTVKPDFVGMQEVRKEQSQDILRSFYQDYDWYDISRDTGTAIFNSSGEGVGILSRKDRFTIEDKGHFWLADPSDQIPEKNDDGTYSSWHSACRRIVVWVKATDLFHSNRTVYFFATHFDHISKEARLNSSNLMVSKIKEITGVSDLSNSTIPIFLVADFNCTSDSEELAPLMSAMKYSRTTAAKTDNSRTYNGFGTTSNSIIDHIFYVGNLDPLMYRVVNEDYGVKYISDHYPILFQCLYKD